MTIGLVKQILVTQFKYPEQIQIANIRTTQGSLFATRYECDATIEGDLPEQSFFGVEMRAVHYTSEIRKLPQRRSREATCHLDLKMPYGSSGRANMPSHKEGLRVSLLNAPTRNGSTEGYRGRFARFRR